jgi:hypothetical protein
MAMFVFGVMTVLTPSLIVMALLVHRASVIED